jgi:hypothetical protein
MVLLDESAGLVFRDKGQSHLQIIPVHRIRQGRGNNPLREMEPVTVRLDAP